MLIAHRGIGPRVDQSTYVAPTAVICGDVTIGADCRIMFGAVIVAEAAPIAIGSRTVIMENAVVRSWPGRPVTIGDNIMVGPGANINSAEVANDVFIATGATIFPGATVGERAIVRANAVVHIDSELPARRVVPEGWTAIGRPAEVVPPGPDERMLFSLYGINFTEAVFGEGRAEVGMQNCTALFAAHLADELLPETPG